MITILIVLILNVKTKKTNSLVYHLILELTNNLQYPFCHFIPNILGCLGYQKNLKFNNITIKCIHSEKKSLEVKLVSARKK